MSGMANWKAKIELDIKDLQKQLIDADEKIDKFANEDRKVKLDIDTKTLESAIQKLDKMLDSIGKGTGDFKQFENLSKELSSIVSEVQSLSKAFGKVDDSGTKTLLSSIQNIDKSLSELSQNILNVNKNMGNMGGNTSGVVKQVENISNAYQNAAKEAEKLADAQSKIGQKTNISSGMKDAFPKTSENLEQVAKSEQKVQQEAVATDKALDNISFTPNTEGFDDIIAKFGILREQAEQITKIVKTTKQTADGMPNISYKATLRNGSSYYLGENSTPQVLNASETVYDAKADNAKKLEREKQIWNELTTSLDRYATLQKRIASNNALSTDNEEATKLLEHIHELQRNDILPAEKLTASNEKLQLINQTVTDLKAKLKESTLDSVQGSIDKYRKIITQAKKYPSDFHPSTEYNTQLAKLESANNALKDYKASLQSVTELTKDQQAEINKLTQDCEKAATEFKKLSAAEKGTTEVGIEKAIQRINKDLAENTKYSAEAKAGLNTLLIQLTSGDPSINLRKITEEMIRIENAEIAAGRAGKSLWDIFKTKSTYGFIGQMQSYLSMYVGFYGMINAVRKAVEINREFDTTLTEMRKVSDETLQSLKNYQSTTFNVADAVGTTAKQIQESTADYMRLGESLDEASESAKTANVLFNVSEFDNIEDATKSLVSMGQAYKDLDKMTIVDKLNEVGNNYAISTDELATALQKSSATLSLMGNTIDEAASLVTTANATIQDADSVSAGLRTISLRLVGTEEAEKELSVMNEEVDAFVKATNSKKQQIIKDYTAVASNNYQGFDILDSNGNYKNTYEILLGIAKVYKEIQEQDKKLGTNHATALIEELAGKNRSNIASAILQDPTQLEAVKKSSENSKGSAQKELEKFLDSIDGKMLQLENRASQFWATFIKSDTIKNGISLVTTLIEGVTKLVDTAHTLPALATTITGILSIKDGRGKLTVMFQ